MNFASGGKGSNIEKTNRWFVNGAGVDRGIVFRRVGKEETIRLPLELWGTDIVRLSYKSSSRDTCILLE